MLWTKTYSLNFPGKKFNIYITNYDNTNFLGGVLYYTKEGEWSNTENLVNLKFEFEQFVDLSEDEVYKKCVDWVDNTLGTNYEIHFSEVKNF
ncbi:hypothetical protein J2X97_000691 [Epilithonimonas hungarica]|uniref:hypothetical protein n=1 Tax=Epilithonimonas hungarica TaxID=454006 RepID=UPI00278B7F1C|nr:hypothetical protein [Epilithonimonas hungarica]MDP9955054.1 hypothetical protein [Epilithonimonas hungarica]